MKHIFYLIGIFYIFYEIYWLSDPIKQVINTKKLKGREYESLSENEKRMALGKIIPVFIFWVWLLVGLLTFNWVIFLSLILFNVFFIGLMIRISENLYYKAIINSVDTVIGILVALLVIVNSYHLKIDFYQLILNNLKP